MSKLKELELAVSLARNAYWQAESKRMQHRNARQEQFSDELAKECEQMFGEELRRLSVAQAEAEKAIADERERIALSGEGLKYPVGTVMVEWERPRYYGDKVPPLQKSGERGVVEVITADSLHPGRGSKASRGTVVIRLFKKDGTKGLKYIDRRWNMDRFYPDGVDPNTLPKEEAA